MDPLPLLPDVPSPRRCRCGRPVPKGPLVEGWGSGCAVEHGVTPAPTPRVTTAGQEGESLLDLLRVDAHRVGGNGGVAECSELRGGGESVSDMIEWLNGVLDQREKIANDAGGLPWATGRRQDLDYGPFRRLEDGEIGFAEGQQWPQPYTREDSHVYEVGGGIVALGDITPPAQYRHIALNDPKQILDDVAADRAILAMYETAASQVAHARAKGWQHDITQAAAVAYLDVVKLIATKYATWPGYQQSWAPEGSRG